MLIFISTTARPRRAADRCKGASTALCATEGYGKAVKGSPVSSARAAAKRSREDAGLDDDVGPKGGDGGDE